MAHLCMLVEELYPSLVGIVSFMIAVLILPRGYGECRHSSLILCQDSYELSEEHREWDISKGFFILNVCIWIQSEELCDLLPFDHGLNSSRSEDFCA